MLPSESKANRDTRGGMPSEPTFKLQFLGAGDTFCNGGRANQAILCRSNGCTFLLDCGPTTPYQAQRLDVDLSGLDAIFLTHIHGDHVLGFPLVVLHLQYVLGRTRPLTVFTPPGGEDVPMKLLQLVFPDVVGRGMHFDLDVKAVEPNGSPFDFNSLTVRAFPMNHSIPVNGYRFDSLERSVAISGDTMPCDGLVELADGVDLLVTECSYPETIDEVPHTSLEQLIAQREKLNARRIAVVHSNSYFDPSPFEAPLDGDILEV